MREEVKELWIAALESGEYAQGHSVLTDEQGRDCCLGVLCKLAVKAGVLPPPVQIAGRYEYDGADLVLPKSVSDWAGFDPAYAPEGTEAEYETNPTVPNPDYGKEDDEDAFQPENRAVSLAELNDADSYEYSDEGFVHRYPFPAIANLIREHL